MANAETTIMSGALEDDKGRRLLPETTAAQVIHTDGESSETKFKRQAGSANMSATLAASAAKTVVDLSAYITNRSKTSYRLEILAIYGRRRVSGCYRNRGAYRGLCRILPAGRLCCEGNHDHVSPCINAPGLMGQQGPHERLRGLYYEHYEFLP